MVRLIKPLTPRKRFGQNFLVDTSIAVEFCHRLRLQPSDNLIEIGAGYGSLTQYLLPIVKKMQAIELDHDVLPHLHLHCDSLGELIVHQADALHFDFSTIMHDRPTRIIGNLPYNISTPLLFHLLKYLNNIQDMHFMLQYEVVLRMTAKPNSAAYGRLSVMLQYFCEIELLFQVPPTAFKPIPKVNSAVVCLKPHYIIRKPVKDVQVFTAVVREAFNLRRKTLRNSLKVYLDNSDWQRLAIDPQLRAQNLSVADYVSIADYVKYYKDGC